MSKQLGSLVIIAAGKGSRMNSETPKALFEVVPGIPNVTNTVQRANDYFERIYVVVSEGSENDFMNAVSFVNSKIEIVPIRSGLGCGHAIREFYSLKPDTRYLNHVITWGDAVHTSEETFKELLRVSNSEGNKSMFHPMYVSVQHEDNPYVGIETDSKLNIRMAHFSKRGEQLTEGFHDMSTFLVMRETEDQPSVFSVLNEMHRVLWKGSKYDSTSGELTFLNVLHTLYNLGFPAKAFETTVRVESYNTFIELHAIKEAKEM
jgi:NDP-sugar pyrophosphorylase family protein